jgi:hypothetical protein
MRCRCLSLRLLHMARRRAWMRPLTVVVLGLMLAVVQAAGETVSAQQEHLFPDNCYYLAEAGEWTQKRCPQSDGSNYYFAPVEGKWTFSMECSDTSLFTACLLVNGWYTEQYSDGSLYLEMPDRQYVIFHVDGSRAQAGYYNWQGIQYTYMGMSTTKNSLAMRNRSMQFWNYQRDMVQAVINSNPSAFYGLFTMTSASNDYANCLHLHDSADDLDGDSITGFTELAEFCTTQAF